jgi:hypothetical protein
VLQAAELFRLASGVYAIIGAAGQLHAFQVATLSASALLQRAQQAPLSPEASLQIKEADSLLKRAAEWFDEPNRCAIVSQSYGPPCGVSGARHSRRRCAGKSDAISPTASRDA